MTIEIDELVKIVRSASRKGFFRQKPIFSAYSVVSSVELSAVEKRIGTPLPSDLRDWLLTIGYGDIDEELCFREVWFLSIDTGQIKGGAQFAQDTSGNFYAFDTCGKIYYLYRYESIFSIISNNFSDFLEELIRRDYKLMDWIATLETKKYEW